MSLLDSIPTPLRDDLLEVREVARSTAQSVYLVGGPVRDALLGRPGEDLDFAVEGDAAEVARTVADRLGGTVTNHPAFATATVLLPERASIDFTTSRRESYPRPGALPRVEPAPIEADLQRRDFTINAIAWHVVEETIVDPHDGRGDLERALLRILHPRSFVDDPTRIIRGARFHARLGFSFESGTEAMLREAAGQGAILTVSVNRVWRELLKSLEEERPEAVFRVLSKYGVMESWLGSSPRAAEIQERVAKLHAIADTDPALDAAVIFHALLLELFDRDQPLDVPMSARKRKLAAHLARRVGSRQREWRSLRTSDERARFCLDHPDEEIAFLATLSAPAEAIALVRLSRELREWRLPFDGSSLNVPPGPHVAAALRDAKVRSWLERTPEEELLAFARRTALRYLNGQDEQER